MNPLQWLFSASVTLYVLLKIHKPAFLLIKHPCSITAWVPTSVFLSFSLSLSYCQLQTTRFRSIKGPQHIPTNLTQGTEPSFPPWDVSSSPGQASPLYHFNNLGLWTNITASIHWDRRSDFSFLIWPRILHLLFLMSFRHFMTNTVSSDKLVDLHFTGPPRTKQIHV